MYTMMKSFVLDQMYFITCWLKHVRQTIRSSDRFMSASKQVAIHRTCPEERATSNSSLPSGMYWIDPDGQDVGDDPINVFCCKYRNRESNIFYYLMCNIANVWQYGE